MFTEHFGELPEQICTAPVMFLTSTRCRAKCSAKDSASSCLTLRKLIEVKRAVGRPKDYEAIAQLEAIL